MTDDFFQKKRVLLTGGAQGLGRSLYKALLERGAEITVVDKKERPENFDGREWIQMDLTTLDETTEFSGFDIVIANAGTYFGGPFLEVSLQQHFRTYEINVFANLRLVRSVLPSLMETSNSRLCFIASITGYGDVPYATSYASSKAALLRFAECLRCELKELQAVNPKISTICPSTIETKLFEGTTPPLLLPLLKPDPLAHKILQTIERGSPLLLEPFFAKFIPLMNGVLPWWLRDRVSSLLGVNSALKTWRGKSHD